MFPFSSPYPSPGWPHLYQWLGSSCCPRPSKCQILKKKKLQKAGPEGMKSYFCNEIISTPVAIISLSWVDTFIFHPWFWKFWTLFEHNQILLVTKKGSKVQNDTNKNPVEQHLFQLDHHPQGSLEMKKKTVQWMDISWKSAGNFWVSFRAKIPVYPPFLAGKSTFSGWKSTFSGWKSTFSGWKSTFSGWKSTFSGWKSTFSGWKSANFTS